MARIGIGHTTHHDQDSGQEAHIVVADASEGSVFTVLAANPNADSGHARSQWVWIRFPDGDLALATFPQDDTYFATELDHSRAGW